MRVCAHMYEYRLRSSARIRATHSVQKEHANASYMQAAIHCRRSSSLVSIVSSSLARNRIRLSINTRDKVVNATIATRRRLRERGTKRAGWKEKEERSRNGRHAASRPTSHPADPIFFKRPAHSSWPDSLTIIKRKSFYSAVSFRLRSYFLPPVSTFSLFFPCLSFSLPLFLFPHCTFAPLCTFFLCFSLFLSFFSSLHPSYPSVLRRPRAPILFPAALSAGYFIIQLLSFAWQKAPLPTTYRTREGGGRKRASRQRIEELPT